MAKTWVEVDVEKAASRYDNLKKERDYLKLQGVTQKNLLGTICFYEKRIAGLKGYINILKEKKCLKKQ